jgi:hypothetical protein
LLTEKTGQNLNELLSSTSTVLLKLPFIWPIGYIRTVSQEASCATALSFDLWQARRQNTNENIEQLPKEALVDGMMATKQKAAGKLISFSQPDSFSASNFE